LLLEKRDRMGGQGDIGRIGSMQVFPMVFVDW